MYTSKKTTTVFSASTCYVTATTVTACTRRKKKSIIADLYDEDADISFDTVTRYWIGYIIAVSTTYYIFYACYHNCATFTKPIQLLKKRICLGILCFNTVNTI